MPDSSKLHCTGSANSFTTCPQHNANSVCCLGLQRWYVVLAFRDGMLSWPSEMVCCLGLQRWYVVLAFRDGMLSWPSEMVCCLGLQRWYVVLAFRDAKQYPSTITRLLSSLCRWCVQTIVTKPSVKYWYALSNLMASTDFS